MFFLFIANNDNLSGDGYLVLLRLIWCTLCLSQHCLNYKKIFEQLQVSAVFAITQLLDGAGRSYMPFYLTDYLRLEKVIIALEKG